MTTVEENRSVGRRNEINSTAIDIDSTATGGEAILELGFLACSRNDVEHAAAGGK